MVCRMIKLRFVANRSFAAAAVRLQAGICMPFTPNHVECVCVWDDGVRYIGQHIAGGMQARRPGYDANDLEHELFVNLKCTLQQEGAFYKYAVEKIGMPYDWKSIFSFINPSWNLHDKGHLICSAIMTAALRTKGCEYFPMPLTVPFHHITPRDLLLILSSHVQIDHPEMASHPDPVTRLALP